MVLFINPELSVKPSRPPTGQQHAGEAARRRQYDIACVYALEGKSAETVRWLRESAVTGFHLYPR
jgi:hypothetical protein